MPTRNAKAGWEGSLPFGAAYAGCYSMALSMPRARPAALPR
jgi:organic hydroperoxide reductase OsmC/OhrA